MRHPRKGSPVPTDEPGRGALGAVCNAPTPHVARTRARRPMEHEERDAMKRERCTARRRDGERCGAPAVRGALVCRCHGGACPNAMRSAQARSAIQVHLAAMPYLEESVARLIGSHERYMAKLADGDKPRRCRARRSDGQPCGCWAIRGGYVCRVHGGAAPQVRAKANVRLESARIYREFARGVGRTAGGRRVRSAQQSFRRSSLETLARTPSA
jgi:hypothetical protein